MIKNVFYEMSNKFYIVEIKNKLLYLIVNLFVFTDFLKYAQECFDKPNYIDAVKKCKKMEAPQTGSTPKPESQDEMCR